MNRAAAVVCRGRLRALDFACFLLASVLQACARRGLLVRLALQLADLHLQRLDLVHSAVGLLPLTQCAGWVERHRETCAS